ITYHLCLLPPIRMLLRLAYRLLAAFLKKSIGKYIIRDASLNSRLFSFAQGWGGKEEGLGLISCALRNGSDPVALELGSTLHFEFYAVNESVSEPTLMEQATQGLQIIHMPDVNATKESDLELLNKSRQPTVLTAVTSGGHRGILSSLMQKAIGSVVNNSSKWAVVFAEALLSLLPFWCHHHQILNTCIWFSTAVHVLEAFMDYSNPAAALFRDLGGLDDTISRLMVEVSHVENGSKQQSTSVDVDSSECGGSQVVGDTSAELDSLQPLYSEALVSYHRRLLMKALLRAISLGTYAPGTTARIGYYLHTSVSGCLVFEQQWSSSCQGTQCSEMLCKSFYLQTLPASLAADTSGSLSSGLDELMRHASSLRGPGVDMLIEILTKIAKIGSGLESASPTTDSPSCSQPVPMETESENRDVTTMDDKDSCRPGSSEQLTDVVPDASSTNVESFLPDCISNAARLLETILQNSDTCRIFVEKKGIELCSFLREHLKSTEELLTSVRGSQLAQVEFSKRVKVLRCLSTLEGILSLSNSLLKGTTTIVSELGSADADVLKDLGKVYREILWQVSLCCELKVEEKRTVDVEPESAYSFKDYGTALAKVFLEALGFSGHPNSAGADISLSVKCRYLGKVVDDMMALTFDSRRRTCYTAMINNFYVHGTFKELLTTFEATSQLLWTVPYTISTSGVDNERSGEGSKLSHSSWLLDTLQSHCRELEYFVNSGLLLSSTSASQAQLLVQPVAVGLSIGLFPVPRDPETFVRMLQSQVLDVILPVWNHPMFPNCSPGFITSIISLITHVYNGASDVKQNRNGLSGTANQRFMPPPPDEATIATIVEMGFSRARAEEALRRVETNSVEMAMEWLFSHAEDPVQEDDELARALALSLGSSTETPKVEGADKPLMSFQKRVKQSHLLLITSLPWR
ncbi:UNVERIFIED_CONTAM: E3 ubiquitin-protein ligase UPL2, partial [Sesamum radiatum]